ncbi:hypothetical protein S40293_09761 [Stachybotrys chartarum IBT 40293]|nr:hypothetical protein S40293_09761 [Stachybotrys chartarum IBT 40293]
MAALPVREKTVHVIVFDVSGSMRGPLNLRSNAQRAATEFNELDPKRVQTLFDILCRLVEDETTAGNFDRYTAVVCFGLRDVSTCNLLTFLEKRIDFIQRHDIAEDQLTSGLPRDQVLGLLESHGITSAEAQDLLRAHGSPSNGKERYIVVGYEPLIKLLASAGAQYCETYVKSYLKPEEAGRYYLAFAMPEHAQELAKVVAELPEVCRSNNRTNAIALAPAWSDPSIYWLGDTGCRATIHAAYMTGIGREKAKEVTNFTDNLIAARDRQHILESTTVTPTPLTKVSQLFKRLQSALQIKEGHDRTAVSWQRLLDDIEPYLYGDTPMCDALKSIQKLCQDQKYSSKAVILVSDGCATDGDPLPPAQALREVGATIYACLITESTIEQSRQLRDKDQADPSWPRAARVMFDLASTVTWDSKAVQYLRRRGWTLPTSGSCKLFIQANNPTIIDEFATASRHLGTSSDALIDMFGQISLDDYIQEANRKAEVTDQKRGKICWAHATASVIHLASKRVVGRDVPEFDTIRSDMFSIFGKEHGQPVVTVLDKVCSKYRLHYKECDEAGARSAIHGRRPVVATFYLDAGGWLNFSAFYEKDPNGTLTAEQMNLDPPDEEEEEPGSHAVVLIRCDETSLTFMNSWSSDWAASGFFTIDKTTTLEVSNGPPMRFYDVYWLMADLSREELEAWKTHGVERGSGRISSLVESFQVIPVDCPHCKKSAPAGDYDGSWYEARCKACGWNFKPTLSALVQSLYERNFSVGI